MERVYLGLGSNAGDRLAMLRAAVRQLRETAAGMRSTVSATSTENHAPSEASALVTPWRPKKRTSSMVSLSTAGKIRARARPAWSTDPAPAR